MLFAKTQAVIRNILPDKQFNSLYEFATGIYNIYRYIADRTFYIPSFLMAFLSNNKIKIHMIKTIQRALPFTMVSKIGITCTYAIGSTAILDSVKGSFVECGVARGGWSFILASIAQYYSRNRKTWLFDSFQGLPSQTKEDGIQNQKLHKDRRVNDLAEGYCLGTYDEVRKMLFYKYKLDKDRVFTIKGWFNETLPKFKNKVGDIAVLRLDCDWYASVKCCLDNLYDNVVQGGYIIIDDYQLIGCKKAVDEFIQTRNLDIKLIKDANGRCYWKK